MDRERRSWERQPHDLEAAAKAYRARVRAGALSPAQAAVLTAVGDPAACQATGRPQPWRPRGLILAVGPGWHDAARALIDVVSADGRLVVVVDPDLADHGLAPSDSQDVESGWGLGLGRLAADHHQARLLVGRSSCVADESPDDGPDPFGPPEAPLGYDLRAQVLPHALGSLVVLLGLPEPWPQVQAALGRLPAPLRQQLAAALVGVAREDPEPWLPGRELWPDLLGRAS